MSAECHSHDYHTCSCHVSFSFLWGGGEGTDTIFFQIVVVEFSLQSCRYVSVNSFASIQVSSTILYRCCGIMLLELLILFVM
jgi:hypothetical protein